MTKITFYQRVDGTFQGFHSQDHAGYSAEGQDIVCAAVSALVINFVNSLDELTDDHYRIDVNQEDAEAFRRGKLVIKITDPWSDFSRRRTWTVFRCNL